MYLPTYLRCLGIEILILALELGTLAFNFIHRSFNKMFKIDKTLPTYLPVISYFTTAFYKVL